MSDPAAIEAAKRIINMGGFVTFQPDEVLSVARALLEAEKLFNESLGAGKHWRECAEKAEVEVAHLKACVATMWLQSPVTQTGAEVRAIADEMLNLRNRVLQWLGAGAMDRMPYRDRTELQDILGVPKIERDIHGSRLDGKGDLVECDNGPTGEDQCRRHPQ